MQLLSNTTLLIGRIPSVVLMIWWSSPASAPLWFKCSSSQVRFGIWWGENPSLPLFVKTAVSIRCHRSIYWALESIHSLSETILLCLFVVSWDVFEKNWHLCGARHLLPGPWPAPPHAHFGCVSEPSGFVFDSWKSCAFSVKLTPGGF